ncbi:MAG: cyclic lactone autoinducer peptide [Lachnospiraceae bacterium]|nr:cyclic lactone autoinducer peptide [Lachnospiraceae bacterium]
MIRNAKKNIGNMIKNVAICKANSNCMGFMYEPKKPKKIVKVDINKKD